MTYSVIHNNKKVVLTTSASAEMTFPSVVRDLFMFAPSYDRKNNISVKYLVKKSYINKELGL